jgi:hypothetical protein
MTLIEQPDQTFILTLSNREREALAFAASRRNPQAEDPITGESLLASSINQILKMFRQELKGYEREQLQVRYDALTNAQQAQVDAILALAVIP